MHLTTLMLAGALATAPLPPPQVARIDALLEAWSRRDGPGCVVGVVRDGELEFWRGYGRADVEHDAPWTAETVTYVASMSKQFTATAILLLDREGSLSIDDEVHRHVPELPDYDAPVTLRRMLNHTSGLGDFITLAWYAGARRGLDYLSRDEIFDLIVRRRRLNFEPGARTGYSNTAYWLLALVVERVSGMSYGDFMRTRIFEPLDMSRTRAPADVRVALPDRAQGYEVDGEALYRAAPPYATPGPGGVFTTLNDLMKWDRNFSDPIVGDAALLHRLLEPAVLADGRTAEEASGLVVTTHRGRRVIMHAGNTIGYGADLVRFPDDRLSVAVLCNVGARHLDPTDTALAIADIALGLEPMPGPTPPDPASPLPDEEIERVVGTYLLEDGTTIEVKRVETGATMTVDGSRRSRRLHPGKPGRYRVERRPWTLVFDLATEPATMTFETGEGDEVRAWPTTTHDLMTREDAAPYLGRYFSEELDVAYDVVLEKGELHVRLDRQGRRRLFPRPLLRFAPDRLTDGAGTVIVFSGGDGGGPFTRLAIFDPRERDLRFARGP